MLLNPVSMLVVRSVLSGAMILSVKKSMLYRRLADI